MKKSIFKSKTFWLNLVMGSIATLAYIDTSLLDDFGISEDNQKSVLTFVGAVTALLNIFLRTITFKPLSIRKRRKNISNISIIKPNEN